MQSERTAAAWCRGALAWAFRREMLFLAHENVDWCAVEFPVFSYLVFEISTIRLLYPLRQVAEEYKRWHHRFLEHGDVLNLHKLALV